MDSEERASLLLLGLPFGRVYPNVGADAFEELDWLHNVYLFRFDMSGIIDGPYRAAHVSAYVSGQGSRGSHVGGQGGHGVYVAGSREMGAEV